MTDGTIVYTQKKYKILVSNLIYYKRAYGNISLIIHSSGTNALNANTYTDLATLPVDMRPDTDIFAPLSFIGGTQIGFVIIQAHDGKIRGYVNSETTYYATQITY